jgi:hypothetical protein
MPILELITLRARGDVRQSAVLSIDPALVRDSWVDAVQGMHRGLAFLTTHCGLRVREWLPYRAQLVALGALAVDFDLEEHVHVLTEWFWSSAFGTRYDAAANTRVVSDYGRLREAIRTSTAWRPLPVSERVVIEASRRSERAIGVVEEALDRAHEFVHEGSRRQVRGGVRPRRVIGDEPSLGMALSLGVGPRVASVFSCAG